MAAIAGLAYIPEQEDEEGKNKINAALGDENNTGDKIYVKSPFFVGQDQDSTSTGECTNNSKTRTGFTKDRADSRNSSHSLSSNEFNPSAASRSDNDNNSSSNCHSRETSMTSVCSCESAGNSSGQGDNHGNSDGNFVGKNGTSCENGCQKISGIMDHNSKPLTLGSNNPFLCFQPSSSSTTPDLLTCSSPSPCPPPEVLLYRGASECPICFLFYPRYLNFTRCCGQPICTECFVQIKRADPHPPHDDEGSGGNGSSSGGRNGNVDGNATDVSFVSEPACCPYCMLPDFGVTFVPCPVRSGLEPSDGKKKLSFARKNSNSKDDECAISSNDSSSSLSDSNQTHGLEHGQRRQRRTSVPANDPEVVTTDRIRPDWSLKLANARASAARKSAQATVFHTTALLGDSNNQGTSGSSSNNDSSGNGRSRIGRRRDRGMLSSNESSSGAGGMYTQSRRRRTLSFLEDSISMASFDSTSSPSTTATNYNPGPQRFERREVRQAREEEIKERIKSEQLEQIMMMEAVRLSLLEEEEAKKKREKKEKEMRELREREMREKEREQEFLVNRSVERNLIEL